MFFIPSLSAGLLVAAALLFQADTNVTESLQLFAGVFAAAAAVGFQLTAGHQENMWGRACFTALTVISGFVAIHSFMPLFVAA